MTSQAQRAADIMDAKYGKGWRDRPMLRSPEWIAAWEEAGGVKLPVTEDAGAGDSQDAASAKPLGSPQILPSDAQSVRPDGGEA